MNYQQYQSAVVSMFGRHVSVNRFTRFVLLSITPQSKRVFYSFA